MSSRAAASAAMAVLAAVCACAGSRPAPPLPRLVEAPVSRCGPGDDLPPEAVTQYVHALRAMLLEYEDAAGPSVGGAAWSARRASFRARVAEVEDLEALSRELVAFEAGLAPGMPAGWAARRAAWARSLGGPARLTTTAEALRELTSTARTVAARDEDRERLVRVHVRVSLMLDTCLAAGR